MQSITIKISDKANELLDEIIKKMERDEEPKSIREGITRELLHSFIKQHIEL